MTLSRQLIVLLLVLFLLMFFGTFLISLNNTRDYIGIPCPGRGDLAGAVAVAAHEGQ